MFKCPGQDKRFWKPEDVFEVPCPACGKKVELFKDDVTRKCPSCNYRFKNPKLDMGCAEWCPYAEQCLGQVPGSAGNGPEGCDVRVGQS